MSHLTGLAYLNMKVGRNKSLSVNLLQVLNSNHNTLRVVTPWCLENIGFKRWTELLSTLQYCVNLVKLETGFTSISSSDTFQWTDVLRDLYLSHTV